MGAIMLVAGHFRVTLSPIMVGIAVPALVLTLPRLFPVLVVLAACGLFLVFLITGLQLSLTMLRTGARTLWNDLGGPACMEPGHSIHDADSWFPTTRTPLRHSFPC